MVSCIERAIGCLSEIAHSTSAYNLLAGEALLFIKRIFTENWYDIQ
jgi:hypothetical protein